MKKRECPLRPHTGDILNIEFEKYVGDGMATMIPLVLHPVNPISQIVSGNEWQGSYAGETVRIVVPYLGGEDDFKILGPFPNEISPLRGSKHDQLRSEIKRVKHKFD